MDFTKTSQYKKIMEAIKEMDGSSVNEFMTLEEFEKQQTKVFEEQFEDLFKREITKEVVLILIREALDLIENKLARSAIGILYFCIMDAYGKGDILPLPLSKRIFRLCAEAGVNLDYVKGISGKQDPAGRAKYSFTRRSRNGFFG